MNVCTKCDLNVTNTLFLDHTVGVIAQQTSISIPKKIETKHEIISYFNLFFSKCILFLLMYLNFIVYCFYYFAVVSQAIYSMAQ